MCKNTWCKCCRSSLTVSMCLWSEWVHWWSSSVVWKQPCDNSACRPETHQTPRDKPPPHSDVLHPYLPPICPSIAPNTCPSALQRCPLVVEDTSQLPLPQPPPIFDGVSWDAWKAGNGLRIDPQSGGWTGPLAAGPRPCQPALPVVWPAPLGQVEARCKVDVATPSPHPTSLYEEPHKAAQRLSLCAAQRPTCLGQNPYCLIQPTGGAREMTWVWKELCYWVWLKWVWFVSRGRGQVHTPSQAPGCVCRQEVGLAD